MHNIFLAAKFLSTVKVAIHMVSQKYANSLCSQCTGIDSIVVCYGTFFNLVGQLLVIFTKFFAFDGTNPCDVLLWKLCRRAILRCSS